MKLRYYSDFKSLKENAYRLEIHTALSTYSTPITLSPEPINVEYESDALYQPLKLSNATISLLTDNILTDLYTGENQGVEIRLYDQTENVLEWFGYLTPNLYSSEYITSFDSVELEAIDTLSSLDNIKYSYIGTNGTFRAFSDVLFFILDKADPQKKLNKVYIQKTNRMSKESLSCLFNESYIHERNFFDESNEPSTCRDVLESLAQYYGMTVIQWRDAYYLIDYDFISRGNYEFFAYNRTDNTYTDVIFSISVQNVSDIGVSESAGNISLGDVYNKASVVANMNMINGLSPDLFDDDDLINQNDDENKYYEKQLDIDNEAYTMLNAYFKSKNNWECSRSIANHGGKPEFVEDLTTDILWDSSSFEGVFFQKCDNYKNSDGEPSSLNWNPFLSMVSSGGWFSGADTMEFAIKQNNEHLFKDGYFIVNAEYHMSVYSIANEALPEPDEAFLGGIGSIDTLIPCRFSVGNHYFDGDKWASLDDFNLKVSRGYYKDNPIITSESGGKLYYFCYLDEFGYKRFVSKSEYDKLPSGVTKWSGGYVNPNRVYAYRVKDREIMYINEEYYHECVLRDGFYLVTKHKEGDKIFGESKSLSNTVSYRLNLADTGDGVAIKLPSNMIMHGDFKFKILKPNHLSSYPNGIEHKGKRCNAFHFNDISVRYTNAKHYKDIFNVKNIDTDIVYNNAISDNNVTELDDINLFVNTHANGLSSYSNAATKIGDKFDYIKDIYSPVSDAYFIPEQILIDKLYRHYCSPKFKYQNCLNRGFSILSRIKEKSLNKTMVVDSTSINYANESCIVNLIEV